MNILKLGKIFFTHAKNNKKHISKSKILACVTDGQSEDENFVRPTIVRKEVGLYRPNFLVRAQGSRLLETLPRIISWSGEEIGSGCRCFTSENPEFLDGTGLSREKYTGKQLWSKLKVGTGCPVRLTWFAVIRTYRCGGRSSWNLGVRRIPLLSSVLRGLVRFCNWTDLATSVCVTM